jgi:hypothetical protein
MRCAVSLAVRLFVYMCYTRQPRFPILSVGMDFKETAGLARKLDVADSMR